MDYKQLLKDIDAKKFKPVYLLHGDESYYIDKIAEYMENNILTDAEKDFNCSIFYGKDTTAQQVIDACVRFPMFSAYSLVILRETQMMKAKGTNNEIDKFEPYLLNPSPSTILVFCYKDGKFDARKKMFKLITKNGVVFESKPLLESQVPVFIETYLKRKKITVESKASRILVEYLGTDLSKIINELEKLCINVKEGEQINSGHIEKNIGISKDYNVYALQSALLTKNSTMAFTIVQYFNDHLKSNPIPLTLANIHAAFLRLYHFSAGRNVPDNVLFPVYGIHSSQRNEYHEAVKLYSAQRVEEILELMLEFDLRSKGLHNVKTSPEELLKELVSRILN